MEDKFDINAALSAIDKYPDKIEGVEENTLVLSREISGKSIEAMKIDAENDAKKVTQAMREYVSPKSDDTRSSYLDAKQNGDMIAIASLNAQIEHTKKATDMLMDATDIERDPKLFASLAQLNKSLTELIKTRNELISSIEAQMAYSAQSEEEVVAEAQVADASDDKSEQQTPSSDTATFIGTKSLIQQILEEKERMKGDTDKA